MNIKKLIKVLGFLPKENTSDIYQKVYSQANNYVIEIDFEKETINYGDKITAESKTTQNFSQDENWVVLECVDRLLEKGYKPSNIVLEKTWKTGHGTSGRLDILVNKDVGTAYLMIECKTWGTEFENELKSLNKDGGQLFTYFQQDKNADVLILYTSRLEGGNIEYRNNIIEIEEDYRYAANVKDFYVRWNKISNTNGFWGNPPYDYKRKIFTKKDLIELSDGESKKIFNEFASILRKHSVSDKPNAFNKIFNLFLAKLYDEAKRETDELEFRWREDDNAVNFQVRLINLHKEGLYAFLEKEIEGIDDKDFKADTPEELLEKKKKVLKFNNILAIKEVLDDGSFDENQRVLKDVVKLLEKYQIRYPRKQQHLSNFFEKLLTTGLKQEVGQFFTPPPITKFIVRSLPIKQMIEKEVNKEAPELPAIIDYAAGSGHFITEILEEYQDIINAFTESEIKNFYPKAIKQVKSWREDPYEWASKYVYGIEKDYRLVKVAKVGCYFYGDGVAQVIHGDGLDSFKTSKTYKGLLKENTNLEDSSKAKFSLVLSNPPYSVNDCKDDLEYIGAQNEFTLYPYLTDKSDDIECLFVERTKHLLKDGGIAAIILPSSILNNTGIYTQTREIILKYFDIIGITELGSGTFMATGTNTIILFLRRRNNEDAINIEEAINKSFTALKDVTIYGIEKPLHKYVSYVWEGLSFDDYITLMEKNPNEAVKNHEIFKEYDKKIKAKSEAEKWNNILALEKDKLLYFIITYPQKLVLVKTGEKNEEKRFLGYEFSNRRGGEGIHPMQRGKTIEECTKLFDKDNFDNPEKASTYIYKAFKGEYDIEIADDLKNNISYHNLIDMLDFERVTFEKNISLSAKKKVKIESKYEFVELKDIVTFIGKGKRSASFASDNGSYPFIGSSFEIRKCNEFDFDTEAILIGDGGNANIHYLMGKFSASDHTYVIEKKNESLRFIYNFLLQNIELLEAGFKGQSLKNVSKSFLESIKIPLPPKEVQEKIVKEIEVLEEKEVKAINCIAEFKKEIIKLLSSNSEYTKLKNVCKYAEKRIDSALLTPQNYVGVDNLLQNTMGKTNSKYVPESGTSTKYNIGDILLSNIRPYLKKIWFADNNGGSSNDVLVIQANSERLEPKYIYYILKQDEFFDYEMQKPKGIKMPRGDKQHIMDYSIPFPSLSEQEKIVAQIEEIEIKIAALEKEIAEIPKLKEEILKKYL